MKKLLAVFLMLGALNVMAAEVNVKVSGMVCSMCAQGIQKKFSAIPGVKNLNVDLTNKFVKFETGDQEVSDETITKLITEAGYNVASIERK
ncbi:heavy-metal-associated domain-containing protein [Peredibacter sp. HCB2-198]|uniref:heavy-metal-associated domain-containing protein n=1 Tax=Peredibacter sp. HCB2-198 TaxID=3383025 RepID=UPI0038B4482B